MERLPDALLARILSLAPAYADYRNYRMVCKAWRAATSQVECLHLPPLYRSGCFVIGSFILPVCADIAEQLPALKKLTWENDVLELPIDKIAESLCHLQELSFLRRVWAWERPCLPAGHSRFEFLRTLNLHSVSTSSEALHAMLTVCPKLESLKIDELDLKANREATRPSVNLKSPHLKEFEIGSVQTENVEFRFRTPLLEKLVFRDACSPQLLVLEEHQLVTLDLSLHMVPVASDTLALPSVSNLTIRPPKSSGSLRYEVEGGWERVLQTLVDLSPSLRSMAIEQKVPELNGPWEADDEPIESNKRVDIVRFFGRLGDVETLQLDLHFFECLRLSDDGWGCDDLLPCLLDFTVYLAAPIEEDCLDCLYWILENAAALETMRLCFRFFRVFNDVDVMNTMMEVQRHYPDVRIIFY